MIVKNSIPNCCFIIDDPERKSLINHISKITHMTRHELELLPYGLLVEINNLIVPTNTDIAKLSIPLVKRYTISLTKCLLLVCLQEMNRIKNRWTK